LQRLSGGGQPTILDHRVELVAQRADGTPFPVELTITRVDSRAGIVYSGFVRDITDRRQMLDDLKASRSRLITVSDEARKRVERDLHDGAQQQLVALMISIGAARTLIAQDPDAAVRTLDTAADVLVGAINELRDLASGIHSPTLTEHGLPAALQELSRRSAIPVSVEIHVPHRISTQAETTAYYFVAESLTNAAKHGANQVTVVAELIARPATGIGPAIPVTELRCVVTDDGPGGADPRRGSGLSGLRDRLAAVDGTLCIDSPAGGGTTLTAAIPLS
jgi:signal transduction histidine kinase